MTVNVSAKQLVQQGFIYLVEQVVRERDESGRPSSGITETALMDAPQFAAQVLSSSIGVRRESVSTTSGAGYSSLSHLHKLPVDALKIDRSFVRGLLATDRPAIVESVLALAHILHTNVVAEGVEDEMQATELERLGCSLAQGCWTRVGLGGKPSNHPRIWRTARWPAHDCRDQTGPPRTRCSGYGNADRLTPTASNSLTSRGRHRAVHLRGRRTLDGMPSVCRTSSRSCGRRFPAPVSDRVARRVFRLLLSSRSRSGRRTQVCGADARFAGDADYDAARQKRLFDDPETLETVSRPISCTTCRACSSGGIRAPRSTSCRRSQPFEHHRRAVAVHLQPEPGERGVFAAGVAC